MKWDEPVWYADLRHEPLKSRMFTPELRAAITARANSAAARPVNPVFRLYAAGTGVLAVVLLVMFAINFPLSPDSAPNKGDLSGRHMIFDWQSAIDDRFPDARNEILDTIPLQDGWTYVFYTTTLESKGYRSISLRLGGFIRTEQGWQMKNELGYFIGDPHAEEVQKPWLISEHGQMFMGVVVDPAIEQVRAVDEQNQVQIARMTESTDGYRYWILLLSELHSGYMTLEGLDGKEQVQVSKSFYIR